MSGSEAESGADTTVDAGSQPGLPNWQDREEDARSGWEKAGIPKGEWMRAKDSNDAAIKRAQVGSADFARLMEARLRLHLGPPPNVDFGDISAYKRSIYQDALAEDLRKEIRDKRRLPRATLRLFVAAGLLGLVVLVLALILLNGTSTKSGGPPSAIATADTKPTPPALTQTPTVEPIPAATASVQPLPTATPEPSAKPVTPTTTTAPTPATVKTSAAPVPPNTGKTPPGEEPFFKRNK